MVKALFAIVFLFALAGHATAAAIPAPHRPAKPEWTELKPAQQ